MVRERKGSRSNCIGLCYFTHFDGSAQLLPTLFTHAQSTVAAAAQEDLDGISVLHAVVGEAVVILQRRAAESEAEVLGRDSHSAYRAC